MLWNVDDDDDDDDDNDDDDDGDDDDFFPHSPSARAPDERRLTFRLWGTRRSFLRGGVLA